MRSLAALILPLLAGTALAQQPDAMAPEVLALFPRGEESCYAARADKPKPGQTLTDFYLYRLFDPNPVAEQVDFTREEAIAFDKLTGNGSWTTVMARFSDAPHVYTQVVSCSVWESIAGKVTCGVDCDGGYFALSKTAQGADMSFPPDSGGLSLNASCGEPEDDGPDRWMKPEEAGGGLVMERAPLQVCVAAEDQVRKGYKGDPVSLRERIAEQGWTCLKRSYDKAHLAKHPDQQVAAMALAIKGPVKVDKSPDSYNNTSLAVEVSFKLRDGTIKTNAGTCWASDYEFGCEGSFRLRRHDASSAFLAAGDYDDPEGGEPVMLGTKLGTDDLLFRLDATASADCRID